MDKGNQKSKFNPKLLCRIFTILLATLILAVLAFTVYIFINKPTENQPEQSTQLPRLTQDQASDKIVFEGETEYGYETCYDNDICVVQSAEELAGDSNE